MTKDKIYLLDGYNSVYTLGALTDDSSDILTLNQTLYDGGTFESKNLVSKSFNVETFEKTVKFDIETTRELKKFSKPNQPYSLKIGSSVRYKGKNYDVIGFYYNQFAQLNIVSPILFNSSNLVKDVSSLFYGLKSNDEVKNIINDNLNSGKYSNDIKFPLTVGIKNYKKELTNIQKPPFTTLDKLSVEVIEPLKVGQPLLPYELDLNQLDFDVFKNLLADTFKEGDESLINIKTFKELSEKNVLQDEPFDVLNINYIKTHLLVSTKENALLPYNLVDADKLRLIKDMAHYVYDTPIGKIYPIFKVGAFVSQPNKRQTLSRDYLFGIGVSSGTFRSVKSNKLLNFYMFSEPSIKGLGNGLKDNSNEFIKSNQYGFTSSDSREIAKEKVYVLKENTYYGGFFATSGNLKINSQTDKKVLPFGAIFKKSGIYYYVLTYLSDEYCLCIKTSTRAEIITPDISPYNLTETKASYKKFTKDEVYKAYLKEGHLFNIDDAFYSLPQSKPIIEKDDKKEVNPTIVTDVFLDKRKEQFEVLQNNFPKLGETFLGILSVLDKSLSKPKLAELVYEKGLVYLMIKKSKGNFIKNSTNYNSEDEDKLNRVSEMINGLSLQTRKMQFQKQKQSDRISEQIIDLAVETSKVKIRSRPLYVALKSFKEYQKYLLSRLVLNLADNLQLYSQYGGFFNKKVISYPIHNDVSSLSKETFLSVLPSISISGLREDGDGQKYIYKGRSAYSQDYNIKFEDFDSIKLDLLKVSQVIFVINVLQVLYTNAMSVLVSKANGNYIEFLENSNIVKQIRQYDLSIAFSEFTDLVGTITFTPSNLINIGIINSGLSEEDKILERIFEYGNEFSLSRDGDKENLRELIMQLDKLYNTEFQLYDKIVNNKSSEILNNFPKVDIGQQEEEFDDSDIFGDAFKELGDEFLDKIANAENIEF